MTAAAVADTLLPPAYGEDAVVIVLSANEGYVPYVSCVLQSIYETANPNRDYDIIILNRSITPASRMVLQAQMAGDNFTVRFFDAMAMMSNSESLPVHGHFKLETYFRLIVPEILPWCHKALYLDADLVVLRDISELFDTDVTGYMLAATHDADTAGLYNGFDPTTKPYMDNILKLKDPFAYFQAGVLLLNLDEFRARYSTQEMLEFSASYDWNLLDQDVLNYLCEDRVKYVDMSWNCMMDWQGLRLGTIVQLAPENLRDAYIEARKHPYIVHYAGPGNKPWDCKRVDMGAYFWQYAYRTPYAQTIREHQSKMQDSFEGRRIQIADFWAFRFCLPLSKYVAPPGSAFRRFSYWVFRQMGGKF